MFLGEFEDPAAAACDAGQRIVRHHHRQPGLFHEQFIHVPQQRAAAREHDPTLGHVGSEFRRSLFEGLLDGAHDALQRFLQSLENFVRVQGEAAGHSLGEVAALDRNLANLLAGIRRADLQFDAFRGRLADQDAVVAAHVVGDGFVELVAADADAGRIHDAVERDYRHFRCAAADVEHHGAARLLHREPRTAARGHGFRDDIDAARTRALGRFLDGPPLDLRGAEWDAYQYPGARGKEAIAVHLLDEVLEHLLRVGEVGDDTVLHRPNRGYVSRGPP